MKLAGTKLSDWIWVLYPVIVVVVLLFGTNYLLSSGEMNLVSLTSRREEVGAKEKVVTELKTKLAQLKQVNKDKGFSDLQKLLEAMPASKKVWVVVRNAQDAASVSGAMVSSYKGIVGDVTEASEGAKKVESLYNTPLSINVEYDTSNFGQLTTILSMFEAARPLVRVRSVEYGVGSAVVEFDSAWLPWRLITIDDVATAVPDYEGLVGKAIEQIAALEGRTIVPPPTSEAAVVDVPDTGEDAQVEPGVTEEGTQPEV